MSKKEEIEKLREEIELEELRVKRAKQKAAQRSKSVSKYVLITLLVIVFILFIGFTFSETAFGYVLMGMFAFGLISLLGYGYFKDKKAEEDE